jgi:hypothetical protein
MIELLSEPFANITLLITITPLEVRTIRPINKITLKWGNLPDPEFSEQHEFKYRLSHGTNTRFSKNLISFICIEGFDGGTKSIGINGTICEINSRNRKLPRRIGTNNYWIGWGVYVEGMLEEFCIHTGS